MALTLQNLIKIYNYEEITCKELAKLANFTKAQTQMMYMFWDAIFNQSLIYFSDELVLNNLTDEIGKNAMSHYIERNLKKHCIPEDDYIEIDKEHELIKNYYINSGSPNLGNQKQLSKQTTKRYYAITGRCYKKLLMMSPGEKGKIARDYYLKIEEMVITMKDYITVSLKHKYEMQLQNQEQKLIEADKEKTKIEQEKKQIEQKNVKITQEKEQITQEKEKLEKEHKEQIKKKELVISRMKTLVEDTKIAVPAEYVYILFMPEYAKDFKNVIGTTADLEARLKTYNCKRSKENQCYYAFWRKTYDAHDIENNIRKLLKKFLVKGTKDVFNVRYDYLERLVNSAINGQENAYEILNELSREIMSETYLTKEITYPKANIPNKIIIENEKDIPEINKIDKNPDEVAEEKNKEKEEIKSLDNMTQDELKTFTKDAISQYIRNKYNLKDFDYDKDKNIDYKENEQSYYIIIPWLKFKKFISDEIEIQFSKIKPLMETIKPIVKESETIRFKWK